MTANGFSLDDSAALPWLAAILISACAHAFLGLLLLRSTPARIVTPAARPAATPVTDVELADWPILPVAAQPPSIPAMRPAETAAVRPLRGRATRMERFRALAPTPPVTPAALTPPDITPLPTTTQRMGPTHGAMATAAALPPLPGRPVSINTPSALSALQLWEAAMKEQLERYKRYPDDARLRHEEDTVSVRISVDRNGNILRVAIVNSRGYTLLDQEALQMVQRAAPLPPFPAELIGDRLNIVVPIEFFLLRANPLSGDPLQ